jgi:hypothetical protein
MKNTMKTWTRFLAGVALTGSLVAGVLATTQARAQEGAQAINLQNAACVIARIESERIPFPIKKANTKFELAENEIYLLNGFLVEIKGKPFLRVDFQTQPWLATEKMLQFPNIPLDEFRFQVSQYGGRLVQMAVVVRRNDSAFRIEGGEGQMKLDPILPPVRF